MFVSISNGIISAYPMKGTIDASIPNAETFILQNEKELAEHITIVDLLRNDLSIVSRNVSVKRFRYIDLIKTNEKNLLQVSSEITGVLDIDYYKNIGNIIFELLPAGSISGAPKKSTLSIIRESEIYERGYYTGVFGCFDGKNLKSAVMIRFIEASKEGFIYKSGGGITIYSESESEYIELIDKIYAPIA